MSSSLFLETQKVHWIVKGHISLICLPLLLIFQCINMIFMDVIKIKCKFTPMALFQSFSGGQDVKPIEVSFSRWLDKGEAVNRYNGTLLSHKKQNTAICNDMDGLSEYHAWWPKSDRKSYETNDSLIYGWKGSNTRVWWRQVLWLWVVGTQCNVKVMYHRNVYLFDPYIILLTNVTPNKFNKSKNRNYFYGYINSKYWKNTIMYHYQARKNF